jgi:hypothetical protein
MERIRREGTEQEEEEEEARNTTRRTKMITLITITLTTTLSTPSRQTSRIHREGILLEPPLPQRSTARWELRLEES